MKPIRLADPDQPPEGHTLKFNFRRGRKTIEGFLVRVDGQLLAYENQCRHLSLPLDQGDNGLLTRDGRQLRCQHHGALYETASGLCVRGPCQGAGLTRLKIELKNGGIWLVP